MAQLITHLDEQLLDRIDLVATMLGTDRSQVVERALRHYLAHADDVELTTSRGAGARDAAVDWAKVKSTLVNSRCPYPSCPLAGNCPIEICPL